MSGIFFLILKNKENTFRVYLTCVCQYTERVHTSLWKALKFPLRTRNPGVRGAERLVLHPKDNRLYRAVS